MFAETKKAGARCSGTPADDQDGARFRPLVVAGQRPSDELRDIARDVRRIDDGYRQNPETIAINKDLIIKRLVRLARSLERVA